MTVFRMHTPRGSVSLLAAALLSLCASQGVLAQATVRHPSDSALKSLALSAQDVRSAYGPGARLAAGMTVTNAMEKATIAQTGLNRGQAGLAGRETGYIAEFLWNRTPIVKGKKVEEPAGVFSVVSIVQVYRSSSFARRAITLSTTFRIKKRPGVTFSGSRLQGIGNEALLGITHTASKSTTPSNSVAVVFLQGRYLELVSADAYQTKPATSTVIRLAKLMDRRVRSGG